MDGHGSVVRNVALRIRDSDGAVIAPSEQQGPNTHHPEDVAEGRPTGRVSFVAPAAGTCYVDIQAHDGGGSAEHVYVIEVR